MAITEVNTSNLGNILVSTRTSENMRVEILERSATVQSVSRPSATQAVPANPTRSR
jgi:hypothetical protein